MLLNWLPYILTITKRILVIGSQCVNKQSYDFTIMEKYDKRAVVQTLAVFGALYHVDCRTMF